MHYLNEYFDLNAMYCFQRKLKTAKQMLYILLRQFKVVTITRQYIKGTITRIIHIARLWFINTALRLIARNMHRLIAR